MRDCQLVEALAGNHRACRSYCTVLSCSVMLMRFTFIYPKAIDIVKNPNGGLTTDGVGESRWMAKKGGIRGSQECVVEDCKAF